LSEWPEIAREQDVITPAKSPCRPVCPMNSTKFDVKRNGIQRVSPSKSAASIASIVAFAKTYGFWHEDFSLGSWKLSRPVLLQKLIAVSAWCSF
jgi:hypothetical protein